MFAVCDHVNQHCVHQDDDVVEKYEKNVDNIPGLHVTLPHSTIVTAKMFPRIIDEFVMVASQ